MNVVFADRRARLWSVLIALIAATDLWAVSALDASKGRAAQAQASAVRCEQLGAQIGHLRTVPSVAAARELQATELAARVDQAARSAQIPASGLMRISPLTSRRLGDSAYIERPTELQIRSVTLRQLMGFLCELAKGETNLRATSFRLTAPREQSVGSQWTVDLTLSYLLYSPRAAEPGGNSGRMLP